MNVRKEDLNNRLNTEDTDTNRQLLHLFQIHDSAFPIAPIPNLLEWRRIYSKIGSKRNKS